MESWKSSNINDKSLHDKYINTKRAIIERVFLGRDGGSFVNHVSNRDWEHALACADDFNKTIFAEIMQWRIMYLPGICATLGEWLPVHVLDAYVNLFDEYNVTHVAR